MQYKPRFSLHNPSMNAHLCVYSRLENFILDSGYKCIIDVVIPGMFLGGRCYGVRLGWEDRSHCDSTILMRRAGWEYFPNAEAGCSDSALGWIVLGRIAKVERLLGFGL
jgi:hypothetical protein